MRVLLLALLLTTPLCAGGPCAYPEGSIGRRFFSPVDCPPSVQQSVPSTPCSTEVWLAYVELLGQLPDAVRDAHFMLPQCSIETLISGMRQEVSLRRRLYTQQRTFGSMLGTLSGKVRNIERRSAGWRR